MLVGLESTLKTSIVRDVSGLTLKMLIPKGFLYTP